MVKEKLQVKSSANTHRKQLNVSFDSLDIVTLAKKMKHDCNWIQGDLSTKILLKNSTKKVLLTALHEGTEIKSYQSNDSITFQVIEGRLSFRTRKKCVVIEKDQLLTLKENIKYSLISQEDTVLLLTITDNSVQVVTTRSRL